MKPTIILKANSKFEKLPFASLSCISGIPLIVICAKRLANTGLDVVVATSNLNNHDELVNVLKKFKLQYFRATSKNVLKEFLRLKKNYHKDDIIIKASLENIFNDGYLAKKMVDILKKKKISYFNFSDQHNTPKGFGLEIFRIKKIFNLDKKIYYKNHGEKDLLLLDEYKFKKNYKKLRINLENIEDFIKIKKFLEKENNFFKIDSLSLLRKFIRKNEILDKSIKKEILKKRLIILGGSHDQTGTIKIAKNLLVRSIVFDKNVESPNIQLPDQFILKSATKTREINYFAKKTSINGIILQGPDFPQVSSKIESSLGVKNIPLSAAKICTDKYKMKVFLKKILIPIPKFTLHKKRSFKKSNINFPVIIKPLDKSGSRGVFLCEKKKQFSNLVKRAFLETKKNFLQIEEYLNGPQISTETFILNGKIFTPGFVDRNYELLKFTKPQIIENGGNYPSKHFEYYQEINQYIKKIAKSLKIRNGTIKGDIVIHKNKIYFIEVAVRLSGGDFSETIIPLSSSFNLIKNSINLALQNKIKKKDLKIKFKKNYIAHRYFFSKKGQLINIYGLNKIKKKSWVKKIKIFKNKGDFLSQTTNHTNRLGVFVITAGSQKQIDQRIQEVYKKIKFKII